MPVRAGFIGLGNIGAPMAGRLIAAGLETTVFDVSKSAVESLVGSGARPASTAREVAENADIIGVCVRDDEDVREVMLGRDGLLASPRQGQVIALHSTILPRTAQQVGKAAAEVGVGVVDACVTGGASGAGQGQLTIMVGGSAEDIARCGPAFDACARKVVHTGDLGSGTATKLCNNLMTYLGFLAAFEATLLARRSGLSQEALEEVTRSNGNMTDQMQAFLMLHRLPDEQRKDEGFQNMLRGFTTLAEKDLAVTLAFAREHGVALPGTALVQQLMARVYGLEDENRR